MEHKHIIGLEQVMEYSLEEELHTHTMMAHKDAQFVYGLFQLILRKLKPFFLPLTSPWDRVREKPVHILNREVSSGHQQTIPQEPYSFHMAQKLMHITRLCPFCLNTHTKLTSFPL